MGGKGSGRDAEGMKEARSHKAANPRVKDAESNRAILGYLMELHKMPRIDVHDAEQVESRTVEWMQLCAEYGLKLQVNGYACALGMNRTTLADVIAGRNRGYPLAVVDILKDTYELIAAYNEAALLETQGNPAGLIFLAKNHHGYKDVQERQELHVHAELQSLPPAEVAAKYQLQAGIIHETPPKP